MIVLGWHGGVGIGDGWTAHDGAAVLIKEGKVVSAIEEERLNRIKHSNFFPARAIRSCLLQAGVSIADVDIAISDFSEDVLNTHLIRAALANPALPQFTAKTLISDLFQREIEGDVSQKIRFCNHHVAHVEAAWCGAGFSDGLIVCLDGSSEEGHSGLVACCNENKTDVLRYLPLDQSLGHFYEWGIRLLGYQRFDEYKVMGLAPYGNLNTFAEIFSELFDLRSEGRFSFMPAPMRTEYIMSQGEFTKLRRKGDSFDQCHRDFAASLQSTLERIAMHIITHFKTATGSRNLCLTGGVAHNCTMNGFLLRAGNFEHIYVQPVAHDAGNALGAALSVLPPALKRQGVPRHLYLGTDIGSSKAIKARLEAWSSLLKFRREPNVCAYSAKMLADGLVIGWVQGRSEFGPRALGNRSILADPRPAENRNIINSMIKKREAYRPFAPSVLEEHLTEYFECPNERMCVPYMNITLEVKLDKRNLLGAVTHVDGSARVQAVSKGTNPKFHCLIDEFKNITGVPVVLNTSFNNNFEPIVDSIDDAIVCFITTGLQLLIIGDWVIEKLEPSAINDALLDLGLSIPNTFKLVREGRADGSPKFSIESIANRFFVEGGVSLSKPLWAVLNDSSELSSVMERCLSSGLQQPEIKQLSSELFELWEKRVVSLVPLPRSKL